MLLNRLHSEYSLTLFVVLRMDLLSALLCVLYPDIDLYTNPQSF
jgi:hypothetical protein